MKLIMCIANICSIVVNFKLWFQCNHIIFLSRHFFSSVLIIMFLRVYFSQWLTGFAPLLSVLSISSSFWVKINFSCQQFAVIFLEVHFCWLSIILWLPVWHQYFSSSMLAHYWGRHWIREVHPAKSSILKCSSVMIHIVLQFSFSHWSTDFSSFKNYNAKKYNTHTTCLYNTLIQHVQHILIQHEVVVRISLEILQDRKAGITFFQFNCIINLTQEDDFIKRDPFCFQFSLSLPQQQFEFQKIGKVKVKERQFVLNYRQKSYMTGQQVSGYSVLISGLNQLRKKTATSKIRFAFS